MMSFNFTDQFTCPSNNFSRHPYPYDCRKFYECRDGIATVVACDFHFVFDPSWNWCNDPSLVNCVEIPRPPTKLEKFSTTFSGTEGILTIFQSNIYYRLLDWFSNQVDEENSELSTSQEIESNLHK